MKYCHHCLYLFLVLLFPIWSETIEEVELDLCYVDPIVDSVPDSTIVNKVEQKSDSGLIHAVNISMIGSFIGNVSLNYECNFTRKHSAFVEGFYRPYKDERSFGVGIHYRHYIKVHTKHARFNSPFWAVYFRHSQFSATMTERLGDEILDSYGAKVILNTLGANFGKRWLIGKRLNMGTRIGYGVPFVSYAWSESLMKEVEESPLPLAGLDAELSIGIVF